MSFAPLAQRSLGSHETCRPAVGEEERPPPERETLAKPEHHLRKPLTIQVCRPGTERHKGGSLRPDDRFIVIQGKYADIRDRGLEMSHDDLCGELATLNDRRDDKAPDRGKVMDRLGDTAAQVLGPKNWTLNDSPLHIDLVLSSADLWSFPFELLRDEDGPVFARVQRAAILTRRNRGIEPDSHPWPIVPRVLFAYATPAEDLSEGLIEDHERALETALEPRTKAQSLHALCMATPGALARAMATARDEGRPFTHVHILAHGKELDKPGRWGLRLGGLDGRAIPPETIADALQPVAGLPAVVSLAACESANQAASWSADPSLAQAIHEKGIAIVLASQFPLGVENSVHLTRAFYRPLLRGDDVRLAIHAARLELQQRDADGPDWSALVTYAHLHESYVDQLDAVAIGHEMAILKELRNRIEWGRGSNHNAAEYRDVEALLVERTESIEGLLERRPGLTREQRTEFLGVLASAYKRLGEIRQRLAFDHEDAAKATAATESFGIAKVRYGDAFDADRARHWPVTQRLALQAVTEGCIDEADWKVANSLANVDLQHENEPEWAYGTLAELALLRLLLDDGQHPDAASNALTMLVETVNTVEDADDYAIQATRDQLARYVDVWTKGQGFFQTREVDLSQPAQELIEILDGLSNASS